MKLRELMAGAGGRRSPTSRSPASPNRASRRGRGRCSSACPASRADGHDFAPDAVERGAVALVVERPLDLGVPEVHGRATCAPRWRPRPPRFYGDPTRGARRGRRHRHQRQDDDRLPGPRAARGRRPPDRPARHRQARSSAASERAGRAHHARGDRPAARRSRAMLDGGDAACAMEVSSHALELRRADAIHWAVAIFTNLTQDHLDFHPTMEDYFAAKRRLFEAGPRAGGGQRRRRLRAPAGRRAARRASPSAIESATPTLRAADVGFGADGLDVHASTGRAARRSPLPGRFNVLNALGALAAARALGRRRRRRSPPRWPAPAACPAASSRSTRASPSPCSSTTPTRPTRSRTCCAPRASSPSGGVIVRVRRRRRPRPRQAPADGRVPRGRWPTASSSPRDNPRSRGPRRDHRRDHSTGTGSGPGSSAMVDRRAAIGRAVELARRATSS